MRKEELPWRQRASADMYRGSIISPFIVHGLQGAHIGSENRRVDLDGSSAPNVKPCMIWQIERASYTIYLCPSRALTFHVFGNSASSVDPMEAHQNSLL